VSPPHRTLFAQLQAGKCASASPEQFAAALQLDAGTQQDGQEFMKLLLAKIEAVCSDASGGAGGGSSSGAALAAGSSAGSNFVASLFRGQTSRCVTCSTCGTASDSSKSRVDYYELELYVRGNKTLSAAMSDLLQPEYLTGDNAYACSSITCAGAGKQPASLATRVHAPPPPLLNISLKRFVFDAKTFSRKKVTDKFAFPAELDLAPYLSYDDDSDAIAAVSAGDKSGGAMYDLAAVLLHRGQSASHGHYIALVRVGRIWWRFDDDDVTRLGQHPLGDTEDKAAAKTGKNAKKGDANKKGKAAEAKKGKAPAKNAKAVQRTEKAGSKRKAGEVASTGTATKQVHGARVKAGASDGDVIIVDDDDDDDGDDDVIDMEEPEEVKPLKGAQVAGGAAMSGLEAASGALPPGHYASTEAYLLIYEKRGSSSSCGGHHIGDAAGAVHGPEVPPDLSSAVAAADAALEERRAASAARRQEARSEMEARQKQVLSLLPTAAVPPAVHAAAASSAPSCTDYRWIASSWLSAWASDEQAPGPIDNKGITCPHGALDPVKARTAGKRISCATWDALSASYGLADGPQLAAGQAAMCRQCAADAALRELGGRAITDARAELRVQLEQLMRADSVKEAGGEAAPQAATVEEGDNDVWVSRSWVSSWMKWKPDADAMATAAMATATGAAAQDVECAPAYEVITISDDHPPVTTPAAPPRKAMTAAQLGIARGLAAGPSAGIVCPHGRLQPGDGPAKRLRVSPAMWDLLCAEARAATAALVASAGVIKPVDESSTFTVFPAVGTAHCVQCDAQAVATDRAARAAERTALLQLSKGIATKVVPGTPLVALPASFLAAWRAYCAPGTSLVSCPRPDGTSPRFCTWRARLCPHGGTLTQLPLLQGGGKKPWEASTTAVSTPGHDGEDGGNAARLMPLVVVTQDDGATLAKLYGTAQGSSAEVPQFGCLVDVGTTSAGDSSMPTLTLRGCKTCDACCASFVAAQAAAACVYSNASLTVVMQRPPRHAALMSDDDDEDGGGSGGGGGDENDHDYDGGDGDGADGASRKRRRNNNAGEPADGANKRGKASGAAIGPSTGANGGRDGASTQQQALAAMGVHTSNPRVAAAATAAIRASLAAAPAAGRLAAAQTGAVRSSSRRVKTGGSAAGGSAGRRILTGVSSTDTVWQLKLRILEVFSVHPCDQLLFCAGMRVDAETVDGDKTITLGGRSVPVGGTVYMVSAGNHDPDDVAGVLGDGDVVVGRGPVVKEKGFLGTSLLMHDAGGGAQQQAGSGDDDGVRIIDAPDTENGHRGVVFVN